MSTLQLPCVQHLNSLSKSTGRPIVLASASPRRKDILDKLNLSHKIIPSTFPETLDHSAFGDAAAYALTNASEKAKDVYRTLSASSGSSDEPRPLLIISADTVVVTLDTHPPTRSASSQQTFTILEKPRDADHHRAMLKKLSGRSHAVVTGVTLLIPSNSPSGKDSFRLRSFQSTTVVHFAKLPDPWIDAYVESGDGSDKAGGYGYQSLGLFLATSIEGCAYNVAGFPAHDFVVKLDQIIKDGEL
ncbi:Maf/Ham1 [Gonapodya prolifera JEL478]|uniref:Maf/Ham1 n=1 Tax=Gonapodya prolifera (strain JEL478) TaxID=1344416 RepID=A0A139AR56_GONPJ|nr:Maf/Ham1 [Gonapodya prolifera JEL478]|eukprot:KXS19134.1 Maf/Ham1 [Gonapodya prolifera JEL478]